SKWLSPVVLGLFAAADLIGNIFVAQVNNNANRQIATANAQSNLIQEAAVILALQPMRCRFTSNGVAARIDAASYRVNTSRGVRTALDLGQHRPRDRKWRSAQVVLESRYGSLCIPPPVA